MMKAILLLFLGLFLFNFAGVSVYGQYRKLTVILLRHAEKEITEETLDPELTAAGRTRAEKLIKVVNKYQPDAIYSTQYVRTRETARPLARRRQMMIQLYDERYLQKMADIILSGKYKRLVVVGHNNTTPALANLLIGQNKYKKLGDSEYDKIFIVKIRRYKRKPNKTKDQMIVY